VAHRLTPRQTDRVPAPGRPSLSSEQVRDPVGTLALAYGVTRDRNPVWVAVAQKLYPDDRYVVWDKDHPLALQIRAEWRAVEEIVLLLTQDGRYLARVLRRSPLPKPQRNWVHRVAAACGSDIPPEELIEQVFAEIRSALMPYARAPVGRNTPGTGVRGQYVGAGFLASTA
jgi:hypothetical protein